MLDAGVEPEIAVKLLNNTNKPARSTVSLLKAKYGKYTLTAPKMQKLAHSAITDCLTDQPIKQVKRDKQGNEIIEEIPPTWTNKIAAASMVYDRVEPVIHKAESVSHHVIHPVDLSKYRNDELSTDSQNREVIDISGT